MIYRSLGGIQQFLDQGLHFRVDYLALSISAHWVGTALAAAVWSDILRRVGVHSDFIFDFEAFCVSGLARKIPGFIWYAIGRLAIYEFRKTPRSLVILAMVIESIVMVMAGVIGLGIGVGTNMIVPTWLDRNVLLFIVIPSLILLTGAIGPFAIRSALKRGMRNSALSSNSSEHPGIPSISYVDTLRWLAGETGVIVLAALVYFFFVKSVDSSIPVPYTSLLGAFSLSVAIGPMVMWLPGDIGLRDGFIYLALSPWTTSSFAALITLGSRLWVSFSEIFLGAISGLALNRQIRRMKKDSRLPAELRSDSNGL